MKERKKFNWNWFFHLFIIIAISGFAGYGYDLVSDYHSIISYCFSAAICGYITTIFYKSKGVQK